MPEPFYQKYDFFFKHHLARSYLKRLFANNISSNSFNNLRVETRFFQQKTWFYINICRFFFWNFNMRNISSIFRSSHRKVMLPKLFYQKWDRFCKLTFAWIHRKLLFANNLFPTSFRHVETGFFVLKLELIFYFFCYNFLILNTNEFSSIYFSTHSKVLLPEPFYQKYDFFFKHQLARSYLKRLFANNISSNSFNNLRVETRFFQQITWFYINICRFFFWNFNMRNISSIFRSSHRKVMLPKLFYQKWDRFCKLTFAWIHRKLLFANNLFPTSFRHVETGFFVLKLELIFYFFCYNFLILNTNEFSSIYFSTHSKVLLPEPFYQKYDFFFKHHLARSYLKRLFANNISSNSFNNLRVETRFFQQKTSFYINICLFFFLNSNMRNISSIFRSSHRKVMLPKLFYQKWDRFVKLTFAWSHRKLLFANNLFPTSFRHVETGFFVLKLELIFYFFCYTF